MENEKINDKAPENENENGHTELPEEVEIIGVTFRSAGKIYYFDANGITATESNNVIVDTARGYEYGKVALSNRMLKSSELVTPLRKVLRVADKNDDLRYKVNCEKEEEAFAICMKKIVEHELNMKLIDVEYTFDNAKLLFYFTSEERVDFRELVKDLASVFRTRIELRQIGLRDETKIMGGFGICGREFCCHSFLGDFVQVSIKMAKEQNLSLNSSKISGACGRLMCCLRYEHETYQEELKKTPKVDSYVITPDGPGTVSDVQVLAGLVKVKLEKDPDGPAVVYDRSLLKNKNGEFFCPESKQGTVVASAEDIENAVAKLTAASTDTTDMPLDEVKEGKGEGDIGANKNRKNNRRKKKKPSNVNSGKSNEENGGSQKNQKAKPEDNKSEKAERKNNPAEEKKLTEKTKENNGDGEAKKHHYYKKHRRNNKNRPKGGENQAKPPKND